MSNVFSLATRQPITSALKTRARRKAAPAPAPAPAQAQAQAQASKTFSRTDSLAPHLLEPGHERNGAIYVALYIAMSEIKPALDVPRNPHEALRKTRRALAILEIECAELDRAALKGGAQ